MLLTLNDIRKLQINNISLNGSPRRDRNEYANKRAMGEGEGTEMVEY